ncbi:MAG: hypothetical protein N5P05_003731 [Chroococcopsis gigantea SAG 12.99]|jgi:hypothetical protein|nr:hypothetical protein [Chroococcopsis gigantea SAG 12.99]
MNYKPSPSAPVAPCIIDTGLVVNKDDIRRLLNDLGRVRYVHTWFGETKSEGEGWVMEVFADPHHSTIVANRTLYINVYSFDYLQIDRSTDDSVAYFDLIQDHNCLRLIPLTNPLDDPEERETIDVDTLEAMVNQVLSAKWDVNTDDDDDCPF